MTLFSDYITPDLAYNPRVQTYCSAGPDAETVILLHGLGFDLTIWHSIAPLLSRNYRVVLYDIRGHGHSPAGTEPFTWELLCADVAELAARYGKEPVHLVGYGIGAVIGAWYSLSHSRSVRSLTVISAPGFYPSAIMEEVHEFRRSLVAEHGIAGLAGHMIPNLTLKPEDSPDTALLNESFERVHIPSYFELERLYINKHLSSKDWSRLSVPVLLLAGENDRIHKPYMSGLISEFIPSSSFSLIPNASNMAFIDQPEAIAAKLIDFLSCRATVHCSRTIHEDPLLNYQVTELFELAAAKVAADKEDAPPTIRIQAIAGFRVWVNGKEVKDGWNQRKAKQLLLYMAFHPSVTRDQLYEEFWPDQGIEKAQNLLRVSLNHLKKLFNANGRTSLLLAIDREKIRLDGTIECDWLEMKNSVTRIQQKKKLSATDEKEVVALLEQLAGNWLPGYYDNWILLAWDRLENHMIELAEQYSRLCERRGEHARAAHYRNLAVTYRGDEPDEIP